MPVKRLLLDPEYAHLIVLVDAKKPDQCVLVKALSDYWPELRQPQRPGSALTKTVWLGEQEKQIHAFIGCVNHGGIFTNPASMVGKAFRRLSIPSNTNIKVTVALSRKLVDGHYRDDVFYDRQASEHLLAHAIRSRINSGRRVMSEVKVVLC